MPRPSSLDSSLDGSTIHDDSSIQDVMDALDRTPTEDGSEDNDQTTPTPAPRNTSTPYEHTRATADILELLRVPQETSEKENFLIQLLSIRAKRDFTLCVNDDTTAAEVARMVGVRERLPRKEIHLLHKRVVRIFGGGDWSARGEKTMKELGIKEGDRLNIVLNRDLHIVPRHEWEVTEEGTLKIRREVTFPGRAQLAQARKDSARF